MGEFNHIKPWIDHLDIDSVGNIAGFTMPIYQETYNFPVGHIAFERTATILTVMNTRQTYAGFKPHIICRTTQQALVNTLVGTFRFSPITQQHQSRVTNRIR